MRRARSGLIVLVLVPLGCTSTLQSIAGDPESGAGDTAIPGGDPHHDGDELVTPGDGDAATPGDTSFEPAEIIAVEASSDDGNPPENTLDRVFSADSRWSAEGDGEWISYTLSRSAPISYVQIAPHGNSAKLFDLLTSEDGVTWSLLAADQETVPDQPNVYQRFDVTPTTARHLRYVGHGTSTPTWWNSLVEVDVSGYPVNLQPSCTPHSYTACSDGDVFWFDSCDAREELADDCEPEETCEQGQCRAEPAHDLEIIYYNNFEQNTVGDRQDYKADWTDCIGNSNAWIHQNASDAVNPSHVFRNKFEAGEYGLSTTGIGFKCRKFFAPRDEVYLSYRIRFNSDFDAQKGGKLPWIDAGHDPIECNTGADQFGGGMMFKGHGDITDGDLKPYPVFYLSHTEKWLAQSYVDDYGVQGSCEDLVAAISAATGTPEEDVIIINTTIKWTQWPESCPPDQTCACHWNDAACITDGKTTPVLERRTWYTLTERVVANTPGAHDGFIEGYIDGVMVAQLTGLQFRTTTDLGINHLRFLGFFGGSTSVWAPEKDEYISYDDLLVYTYNNSFRRQPRDPAVPLPAVPPPATSYLQPSHCTDGVQSGNEQGVDCDGDCHAICHCSNGVEDPATENGIDCGGECPSCP